MSLIVTLYVNEGIVMASDSRMTLQQLKINKSMMLEKHMLPFSDSANKIFQCPNNCGISCCGDAEYKNKPIAGFVERFIERNISKTTLLSEIPEKLIIYFNSLDLNKTSVFHLAGYELDGDMLKQKVYRIITGPNAKVEMQPTNDNQGALWDGETVVFSKLIKAQIINPNFIEVPNLVLPMQNGQTTTIKQSLVLDKSQTVVLPDAEISWRHMSLQDAVDFAQFAIETTINCMRFQCVNKTVGGPIDVLIIKPTKIEWLKRKKLKVH